MARYRNDLPQLDGRLFLTDGGIETTLIFHEGLELRQFAAFDLLRTPQGTAALGKYFRTYVDIARRFNTGLILESATWRANPDWGRQLGYGSDELAHANREAIRMLEQIRDQHDTAGAPIVISGCIGPRGDGYVPGAAMSAEEAEAYHLEQIATFASTTADMINGMTINYLNEGIGIVRAAKHVGMPVAISFTVETDARLPTGATLRSTIEAVDDATGGYASYYGINCAHPSHFQDLLDDEGTWVDRLRALRANASRKSHAELNESTDLDVGDPAELAADYASLTKRLTGLNVLGGCCGTDHRHLERIGSVCAPLFARTV